MVQRETNKRSLGNPASFSRRRFVSSLSVAALAMEVQVAQAQTTAPPRQPSPAAPILLVQPSKLEALNTRAKIVLEIDGKLHIEQASEEPLAAEVKGKSTLDYLEKIVFGTDAKSGLAIPTAAARRYFEASMENWISGNSSSYKLRPDCVETRFMPNAGTWQQFCENLPLDAREIQLLHSPVNSAAIDLLLPVEPAKPDSTWTLRSEDAKLLFNLDAVHRSTLTAKIVKVEKTVTSIEIQGSLEATANSVPTRLDINGNFQAKLGSRSAIVSWLSLVIKEERQVSQSEPGFAVSARVRLIREETENKIAIADKALRDLANTQADDGRWLVQLKSNGVHYSVLADRRWHIHRDTGEESILRMVENNTVIAQCNISRLAALEPGQQLTVEGLQADIKAAVGKGFREFLESSEKVTSTKLRLIRTVVSGELEEVPIQWIYNHLSDDSGRRLLMIFTMGGNVTDRFAAADEQMTGSFELLNSPEPTQEPQPAGKIPAPKLTAEKNSTAESKR